VALESPLHEWSEDLFTAHMVQHELIMVIAAPLVALGAPLVAALWALPYRLRRQCTALAAGIRRTGLGRIETPGVSFLLHAAALWLWHLPAFYEAALAQPALHAVQHVSFFATSLLFWWTVTQGRYGAGGYGASVLYVFGTATQSGLLGALLALSQRLWYPANGTGATAWQLTALEDQQLAGLVMWIPATIVFTGAGLMFVVLWLRESERRVVGRMASGTRPGGGRMRS
jgi:putative membrane protein